MTEVEANLILDVIRLVVSGVLSCVIVYVLIKYL